MDPATGGSTDCLFCRIVAKEIPAAVVHEDEHVLAFRDIAPQAPLHVLVVPKRHVARVADIADAGLAGRLLIAAAAIAKAEGRADFRLVVNDGAAAGQSVAHVHVHVLAGRPFSWPPG
ncbi:MAG TPA: histidine triad nucleotide-binding protein [Candidatus Limnocylindrales bacterium]|nr:histidine triad nucleotide-binding protein [Candidatus Limnocylindrales bacterium]